MSNGIDFVIGGKDQAKPAMASVEQSLQRLEAKTESLASSTKLLTSITGGLAIAYGVVKSAMAALSGLDKINAAYDESAEAVKGLETALRLQGASVDVESARLQAFASSMQSTIGAEDDATLAMMKQASMMGVATEDLDDMAKAAIGLGEAMGSNAAHGMEMMRQAQEGNFIGLQKLLPQLKSMATDEEKLAAVTELAAKGLEAKADASHRVAGMGERANNAIGDLMESVGALLAPVRLLISAGITTLAESLSTLLVPAVEYANEAMENIGPLMDWVKAKVIGGVNAMIAGWTFLEVILTNLDQVWIAVVAQAELSMLQLAGTIKHTLMEEIPAYAMWFGKNFITMLMGDFDAAMAAMPDIAVRAISQREKELSETIGQVGANLGQQFADKFAERVVGMGDDVAGELDKTINLKMSKQDPEGGIGKRSSGTVGATINAMESRLLTRGPATTIPELLQQILQKINKLIEKPMDGDAKKNIDAIKKAAQDAAKNKMIAVPVP